METTNQSNLPPGWAELDEFIFHPDQYHAENVPKGIHRDSIAKFIEARMNAKTPRGPFVQAEKVVDYYDLQEACPHLRGIPSKKEKTPEEIMRSAVIVRTIALVCLPPDISFAADYAKHLAALSSTLPEFQDLIGLNDALEGKFDGAQLKSRMEARLADLNQKRQADYQAQLEYANLEDTMNIKLNRSQKANELKAKILAIPNRSQRISEEIKAYLGIQYGYLEFTQVWAARRLRRETWAEQPAQQTQRTENPPLRQGIAKAFLETSASLAPSPQIPKENLDSLRVRCLRAVDFFGGELSARDRNFIEAKAGKQTDLLSK